MRELKVGDWVRVVKSKWPAFPVGALVQVDTVDGASGSRWPYRVTYNHKLMWLGRNGHEVDGMVQVEYAGESYPEALESKDGVPVQNAPWYLTDCGQAWLAKNMPLPPEELRIYRRGQVFRVVGFPSPYMLASFAGKGGVRAGMISLSGGNRFGGRTIPVNPQYTYDNISDLFNEQRFELVADSAEDYFKEKYNAENN